MVLNLGIAFGIIEETNKRDSFSFPAKNNKEFLSKMTSGILANLFQGMDKIKEQNRLVLF